MEETAKECRARARALRVEGQKLIREAEALFERANWLDSKGRTDLQEAILDGRKADAKRFIRAGADPSETGETDDRPPLVLALEASKEEGRFSASLALALVKAGADPNAKCRTGRSVLAYAIQREEFGIALALLKAGADPRDPEASQAMEKVIREIGGFLGDKEIEAVAEIRGLLIKKPGKKRETL